VSESAKRSTSPSPRSLQQAAPGAITRLLISCADRPGIVAATSRLLTDFGANIVRSDQHTTDPRGGTFFMRMEFDLQLSGEQRAELQRRFAGDVAEPLQMQWRMWDAAIPKRVAILVSRQDHCLLDLLWRWRRGQLQMDVGLVASNHPPPWPAPPAPARPGQL